MGNVCLYLLFLINEAYEALFILLICLRKGIWFDFLSNFSGFNCIDLCFHLYSLLLTLDSTYVSNFSFLNLYWVSIIHNIFLCVWVARQFLWKSICLERCEGREEERKRVQKRTQASSVWKSKQRDIESNKENNVFMGESRLKHCVQCHSEGF